jgi:O-antigen ligase
LIACLLFGGASAAGLWSNLALQLVGLTIILWALLLERSTPMAKPGRQLIGLVCLGALLVVVQLIPLPPSVWAELGGREPLADGFRMLGEPIPWLPISLAPYKTVASALWTLPAIAVLLSVVRLGSFKPAWLAWGLAVVTTAAVAIGGLQVGGGEQSPWYFYTITNRGSATGFFSNANHMATLLVVMIPFLAALYLNARAKGQSVKRSSGLFVVLAGALAVLAVGIVVNGSLAGLGLCVPVLAASGMMIVSRKRKVPRWAMLILPLLIAGSVAVAFSAPFGNNLIGRGAASDEGSRYTSFLRSIEAAKDFAPLGSGIGTFRDVYPQYEDRAGVTPTYMNHVHSDLIELALETGVPGLLLIILFLMWWGARLISVWTNEEADYYERAATIASAAILAHSLVDYPLRTTSIAAVFAMCCGLMAESRVRTKAPSTDIRGNNRARHLSAE